MNVFERVSQYGHEQVAFCHDESSGLKAIIGIHDTTLGPALGGLRMWPYESEEQALTDVLRLSQGMTYKSAAMGLNLGGGKAVIIGDPRTQKSEELFRAFGKFVHSLGGRYITAEDVGTSPDDIVTVGLETPFVAGLPGRSGDPSPYTALGVYQGIRACLCHAYGNDQLTGRTVAVQGAGSVGYYLIGHLVADGARVVVTDIYQDRIDRVVNEFGVAEVRPDEIYDVECDVFSPCALGAVINDDTMGRLKCRIVAGGANNQLAEPRHGEALFERGTVYAPDFVINGGGVTAVAEEFHQDGFCADRARNKVNRIFDKVMTVLDISSRERTPTHRAAILMAEQRLEKMRRLARVYLPR